MGLQSTTLTCLYSSFRHYYLCPYLPLSAGKDMISHSLLKFKHRTRPDFNLWMESALEALQEIPPPPDTIILRALHHDETIAAPTFPTALDFLGHAIASRFACRYLPTLLRKSHPIRPCKELSRRQRKKELQGIYSLDPVVVQQLADPISALPGHNAGASPISTHPPFLLIDDILTTGTTMRMIIRPLRRSFPHSPIRIFTLARARAGDTPKPLPSPQNTLRHPHPSILPPSPQKFRSPLPENP